MGRVNPQTASHRGGALHPQERPTGPPVKAPLAAAYATLFFALGVYMPFFPLWLKDRGLGPQEIGIALAVPLFTRLMATPFIGILSDRLGRPKAMLVLLGLVSTSLMGALAFCREPLAIFVVLGLCALAWNPSFALIDAYATRQARARRVDYGRSRLWGSGSFVLANLAGGMIVSATGAQWVVALMVAGQVAYLAASLLLPELPPAEKPKGGGHIMPRMKGALVAGTLAAAAVQSSHGALYAFASLNWQAQGLSLTTIGVLWAIGVVAEMMLFRFGTRLAARFGPAALIGAGGVAAALRFAVLATEPPLYVLAPLQLLHGLTFGATYLGLVDLVARSVSEAKAASGQSIASWTVSLTLSTASAASGPLWLAYGASSFLVSAGLGALGIGLALLCFSLQPHNSGSGG